MFKLRQVSRRVHSRNRVRGIGMFDPSKIKGREANIERPAVLDAEAVGCSSVFPINLMISNKK